ncbi:MAG: hypothetical protein A3F67_02225 [Verrucomicrobia bacterium RIFCSPHIGHO2_12_FULL_41_10]|nr:MAG: hypothetical protein A3F67_02225 [Verrucomicrobia bacterium RIFCSPHIGHO2_12_FULL_41_10]
MELNHTTAGHPGDSIQIFPEKEEAEQVSHDHMNSSSLRRAPVSLVGGRTLEISLGKKVEEEEEDQEIIANHHAVPSPSNFAFPSLESCSALNASLSDRAIHQEFQKNISFRGTITHIDSQSDTPTTSVESEGTPVSQISETELERLMEGSEVSSLTGNSTPTTESESTGTPVSEISSVDEERLVEGRMSPSIVDHGTHDEDQEIIAFRNSFSHAFADKIAICNVDRRLTPPMVLADVASAALHSSVLTQLRYFCNFLERTRSQFVISLAPTIRSAIDTAYIQAAASGQSPIKAAQSTMKAIRLAILQAPLSEQAPRLRVERDLEPTWEDWFSSFADVAPSALRAASEQRDSENLSSAPSLSFSSVDDWMNVFNAIHASLAATLDDDPGSDAWEEVARFVGGYAAGSAAAADFFKTHPSQRNVPSEQIDKEVYKIANKAKICAADAASNTIEEAKNVMLRAIHGISQEIANLRPAEATVLSLVEPMILQEFQHTHVVTEVPIATPLERPAFTTAIPINDHFFYDPEEEG